MKISSVVVGVERGATARLGHEDRDAEVLARGILARNSVWTAEESPMYGYRARSLPGSLASSNGDWTGAVSLKRMWRSSTSALYLARSSPTSAGLLRRT